MAGELDPNQITQQMLNPQSQGGDDPIQMLTALLSMLGPNSADAASQPDPNAMAFKLLQQRNQQTQRDQQNQLAQQRMKQQQQQFNARQNAADAKQAAKLAPKPSIADILQGSAGGGNDVQRGMLPGDVLGGGVDAPITYGRNPRTGNYSFNNFGYVNDPTYAADAPQLDARTAGIAAKYASPEMKQRVEAAKPENRKATSTPADKLSPERTAQMAQLAEQLKSVPEATRNLVLRTHFPEIVKEEEARLNKRNDQTLTRQKTMADYNARLRQEAENNKPLAPELQKQLGFAEEMQRQVDTLAQFVDKDEHAPYVGLGADTKYDLARRVNMVDPQEVSLRRSLAELKNVQLYMRSGVAINENEAQRLINELPDSTDASDVFKQKFQDFQKELAKQAAAKKRFGTATRGEIRAETGAAPLAAGQGATPANAPAAAAAKFTPEQQATAAQLIAKAKAQLGAAATPQQIKDLARKLQKGQK